MISARPDKWTVDAKHHVVPDYPDPVQPTDFGAGVIVGVVCALIFLCGVLAVRAL